MENLNSWLICHVPKFQKSEIQVSSAHFNNQNKQCRHSRGSHVFKVKMLHFRVRDKSQRQSKHDVPREWSDPASSKLGRKGRCRFHKKHQYRGWFMHNAVYWHLLRELLKIKSASPTKSFAHDCSNTRKWSILQVHWLPHPYLAWPKRNLPGHSMILEECPTPWSWIHSLQFSGCIAWRWSFQQWKRSRQL